METEEKDWQAVKAYIDNSDLPSLREYLADHDAADTVAMVSHLSRAERLKLIEMLKPDEAAELLDELPWAQSLMLMEELESNDAAAILSELPSDEQADFLGELPADNVEAIFKELPQEEVASIRELVAYEEDSAGGLMITEFLAFDEDSSVKDVVVHLQEEADNYEKYHLQYIYVITEGRFLGVLNVRDLLLSRPSTKLGDIVIRDALTVSDTDDIQSLIIFFDSHDFYGVPVVDNVGRLKGVVLRKDLREAQNDQLQFEHLETQGIVGGEELRTMPVWLRAKRRLSWLSVNILLNIAAASIIAVYQDTLSAVIALAVFLPIISDMSGCSGNQAVAVSLRELSLGVVKPFELLRVLWQELAVGIINGIVLGALIGAAAWLWKGNLYLGLVVGGALTINTLVAVSLGGTIPLLLKRFNVDPALASGPILTTVTDMFGFFLALTFAGLMLSQL